MHASCRSDTNMPATVMLCHPDWLPCRSSVPCTRHMYVECRSDTCKVKAKQNAICALTLFSCTLSLFFWYNIPIRFDLLLPTSLVGGQAEPLRILFALSCTCMRRINDMHALMTMIQSHGPSVALPHKLCKLHYLHQVTQIPPTPISTVWDIYQSMLRRMLRTRCRTQSPALRTQDNLNTSIPATGT